jgi:ribonuclease T2
MKLSAIFPMFAIAVLVMACRQAPQTASPERAGTGGAVAEMADSAAFDYYLLNLSWSPEFCISHPSAQECAEHDAFVLHGLWPQNNDGTYPENCSNAAGPASPSAYKDIYPDSGLLAHEWKKHGTCSGLAPDAYLSVARKAYRSITIPPALAGLKSQASMSPEGVLGLFTQSNPAIPRSSFALSCGNNELTAVEVCLDKSLRPIACSGLRSCRANSVRIPAP